MSEQANHATYRVLVFGRDGTAILLTRSDASIRFPDVTIPQWERVIEHVTSGMNRDWGAVIVCLFELQTCSGMGKSRYIAARYWRKCGLPLAPLQWVSVTDRPWDLFIDPEDGRALHESLALCGPKVCYPATGTFTRLTWFEELCDWVKEALAPKGLHLTGEFRQLNASPTFSLIRFETNGPAVWFKAVGEPNEREFPITVQFARSFPRYAPKLVASRADWKGWLSLEAEGVSLAETTDLSHWTKAASALAKLQIESIGGSGLLLDSDAHDLSPERLDGRISPFLEMIARLMRDQIKVPPAIISDEALGVLGAQIRDAISALDRLQIPDTLGHLDLNPGNIIVGETDECAFLDWAEAYVGHPFYSFQYLLEHFRRIAGGNPATEQVLTDSYLAPWTAIACNESLGEAMALAPLVAVFSYAAGTDAWRTPERLRDPKLGGYFRALVRRMNREANQLGERRTLCLS